MGMEMRLSMKLSQRLIMAPMLQQAIKLLPMTRLELLSTIRTEMEENPFLEELMPEDEEKQEAAKSDEGENIQSGKEEGFEQETVIDKAKEEPKKEEMDWDYYMREEAYDGATGGGGFQERPSIENTLHETESLQDHLLWQLNATITDEKLNEIGLVIISDIDDNGYFKMEHQDIAEQTGADLEDVKKVLVIIKKFEPTGVGAADLKECLLIQAEALEPDDPIVRELISDHLHHLDEKNYAKIAKELKVDVERIMEAVEFIRVLDPAPGKAFSKDRPFYVVPDLYLVNVDGEYQVHLNDEGVPRLKVNSYYRNILKNKNSMQGKTKEFVENKFRSAEWLIKSIEQRRQTMLKVGRSLVKFQGEFMDNGITYLKPLVLKDVAEDTGMHESTISRVTRNKYIHTPQGIFELKFFFHGGVNSYLGSMVSSVRVKEMIKTIVSEEDQKKPATDDQMVKLLQTQNVKIARRTVTKYRKELSIPPASKRKRIY